MSGGTIQDGTYVQVSRVEYGTSSCCSVGTDADTLRFTGSNFEDVSNGATNSVIAGTWSTSGVTFEFQVACPGVFNATSPGYTISADGNTLQMIDPGHNVVSGYTRVAN